MRRTESNSWPQRGVQPGLHPLSLLAAALLAVPVGSLCWFELVYLRFGFTGEEPPPVFNTIACILSFVLAVGWPLYRGRRPAEVVQQSCRLGVFVAVLLPVVSFAVLLLWQSTPGRPDLGMGGLMLYNLPFVALVLAVILVVLFSIGGRMAARWMEQ